MARTTHPARAQIRRVHQPVPRCATLICASPSGRERAYRRRLLRWSIPR